MAAFYRLSILVVVLGSVAAAAERPNVVINCVGVVKQLSAAKDPLTSIAVNALLPHRLAELCVIAGI